MIFFGVFSFTSEVCPCCQWGLLTLRHWRAGQQAHSFLLSGMSREAAPKSEAWREKDPAALSRAASLSAWKLAPDKKHRVSSRTWLVAAHATVIAPTAPLAWNCQCCRLTYYCTFCSTKWQLCVPALTTLSHPSWPFLSWGFTTYTGRTYCKVTVT